MDVQRVLHMNGGDGESSYANNSLPQRLIILKTKPFLEEAVREVITATAKTSSLVNIADLGCAAGPNCLVATTIVLEAAQECCRRMGGSWPEFQVFLNDLPGNDFNAVFQLSVPSFYNKLREKGDGFAPTCFVSATPGSFYDRLFPAQSLHFLYSANSLHWLSQVPVRLGDNMGNLNRGNIILGKTSPPVVFEAYLEQFQMDFMHFLKLRAQELVPRGRMVLSMMGRMTADPFGEECYHDLDDLADAFQDMVAEGSVQESTLDSFNMPYYEPYIEEVKEVIQAEGSFDIIRLEELHRLGNLDSAEGFNMIDHEIMANCVRAALEPTLTNHFGQTLAIDKLFEKYAKNFLRIGVHQSTILVVSLAKKG